MINVDEMHAYYILISFYVTILPEEFKIVLNSPLLNYMEDLTQTRSARNCGSKSKDKDGTALLVSFLIKNTTNHLQNNFVFMNGFRKGEKRKTRELHGKTSGVRRKEECMISVVFS